MNLNSKLCVFIHAHPDDWESRLASDYGVQVKKEGSYAIFNYNSFDSVFSDPIVQESRGIILDVEKLQVVCWPFRKFGNYNEEYADTIDWSTARVLEKVDGSIIKFWYDHKKNEWRFSTNGMISAYDAQLLEHPDITYGELISKANNYADIRFDDLDKNKIYIFELVSPLSKIVISYNEVSLYHIGTRDNLTGIETDEDIGIRKPVEYPIHSLEECISKAVELNRHENAEITKEGFVVVDCNWNRVKVKSPDYILKHKLIQKRNISKAECVDMLLHSPDRINYFCKSIPSLTHIVKYYDFKLSELFY